MSKIQESHLERTAYIYVRQSTMAQVRHNLESQRRQYSLTDRAKELGWDQIQVIDEDLGRSGSGLVQRPGFESLMSAVCQGEVGAVFAVESARLARNGEEWHRLLEFCAIVDTLIVDHDGIYNPKHPNDRLLLGLKGTMSELEISTFRQRSQEAIRQKARRGEYYSHIAEGYVYRDGRLEKDPDEQVQRTLELVFEKFREFGSARGVFIWFHEEEMKLPRRSGKSDHVEFVRANPSRITRILKNPIYAGTYAYGRTRQRVTLEEGRKRVTRRRLSKPADWGVLIPDHHESYISWHEYEKNQETLLQNHIQLGEMVRGAARRGKGLLSGLVRCGRCGRRMYVQYSGRHKRYSAFVSYACRVSSQDEARPRNCSYFGGVSVENAVVQALLDALSPTRMEAAVNASEQLSSKRSEKRRHLDLELERVRYEADRCHRQYDAAEPENRLVARMLEARWDQALEKVDQLEQALVELPEHEPTLSSEEKERLHSLALDLPRLWNHPSAPFELKKRLLRAVIKEIVMYVEEKTLRVLLHWRGGQHTELKLHRPKQGETRWKTPADTLELIRQLTRLMSDQHIAAQLNRMRIRTAKGHTWTRQRVGQFRTVNKIANYTAGERQERGDLTIEEVADKLSVSYSTVRRMIQRQQLPAHQVAQGAPWIVRSEDLGELCLTAKEPKSPEEGPLSPLSKQQGLDF